MAVAFQSLTSFTTASGTTPNSGAVWAYPSSIVAGDALVLAAVNNNPSGGSGGSGTAFTTPTGWTAKESQPGIVTDASCYLYEKTAAGTESGTNITLAYTGTTGVITAAILRYSGNDTVTPFGDTSSAISSPASTTAPTAAALSPLAGATDMVVRMYGWGQDSSGSGSAATIASGWTTRLNIFTNVGSTFQCGCVVLDKLNGSGALTVTDVSSGWMVADAAIHAAATPTIQTQPTNRARLIRASHW